ncbi:MAG: translocation/assembly module TamB, partial [Rikenellaceae bacterium]|nr:translocation/assembly module TamB [Rikenellaceae bacterium]
LLDPMLKSAIENTVGTANARLDLGGTFRNLRMNGTIEVPRIETTVIFTRARYTLVGGVLNVRDSRLVLPPTTLTDPMGNRGELSLGVDLSNFRNVGFELGASVRNLLAMNTTPENSEAYYGRVFATGDVAIRGDRMGTDLNIVATTNSNSRFYLPLSAKSDIAWADFVIFRGAEADSRDISARKKQLYQQRMAAQSGSKPAKPVDLDMTINLTPDAEFNMVIDPLLGNGISANGQGVINMRINPATNLFTMVGDVAISSGKFEFSMMQLFTRDFTITPGSTLVWDGEPTDVNLNVEGTYRVRTSLVPLLGQDVATARSVPVDCLLQLSGQLSNPEITFDVKAPTLDIETRARIENAMNTQELKSMQFLSLLAMKSFVPESSLGQAGSTGSMTNGEVGFDFLTNQLGNILSNEEYNVYFRYKPQNEYTGPAGEFDVGFSKGFIDNRLILEIEGNYVDDRAAGSTGTGNVSNLAGDVYLTWVVDRAGNLRLKVFTQTIDRLDENQGLQEGGIGIYYKKDFDSWRDIRRKNRKRITNFGKNNNNKN